MKHRSLFAALTIALALLARETMGFAEQDRYALKYSNGISFSEFKGYEKWQAAAPSQVDDRLKLITANPVMIEAFEQGFPANGKRLPDGAMMAKIEWTKKPNPESTTALVPDELKKVGLMVKDSKRFPDTDGWGYAQFVYDGATKSWRSESNDPKSAKNLCHQCHTIVKSKDFVFTGFPMR